MKNWFREFIDSINQISNTIWGMYILTFSIYVAIHFNKDIGIYFAGVGSTLLGIKKYDTPNTTVSTDSSNPSKVKVETNASDQTNKD